MSDLLITIKYKTLQMSRNTHRLLLLQSGIILSALLISMVYVPTSAVSKNPQTFPSSASKALSAKWWQWAFSFNSKESPLSDSTGARCDKGDLGRVFFLAGTAGLSSGTAVRDCTISSKQAILFPVANAACILGHPCTFSTVTNLQQLKDEVIRTADLIKNTEASLDGHSIDISRVQSPFFKTTVVADNPFGEPPESKAKTAFADGFWVLLKPLSIGDHELHFKGTFDLSSLGLPDFTTEVTYHLTVK
jgi:hypothetical protein